MTLPTLVKSWQFNVNQSVTSTALTNNRRTLRAIKDSLKGFGSNPWTVVGSSDSVTAALDGSDRWAADGNLIWSAVGNPHSWIVLKQSAIATNFSICVDLGTTTANGSTLNFSVSPSAGYTSGSTTNRPTATDEIVTITTTWGGATGSRTTRIHVMQSTDGQCTRMMIWASNAGKAFWLFDKPQNPVSGWSDPSVSITLGGGDIIQTGNLYDNSNSYGRGTSTFSMYFSTEAYGTGSISVGQTIANDFDGNWPMLPIGLISDTAGHKGKHGTLFDLWFGLVSTNNGDTYPSDASNQFAEFGDLIFPWDGSTPATT